MKINVVFLLLWVFCSCNQSERNEDKVEKTNQTFSVLVWNILHGGQNVALQEDGRPHVINIIKELDPDIVLMIETYGAGEMIADSLNYNFHLIAPEGTALDNPNINLSIMSKFPFGERFDFYRYFNIGGIEIFPNDSMKLNVFDVWLNYQPWSYEPFTLNMSAEELVEWDKSDEREPQVTAILDSLQYFLDQNEEVPLIFGGDFNARSHLDWQEDTKGIHQGMVVNWWTTSAFEKVGLIDSYREVHPDALLKPGHTIGSGDASCRIDYIHYKGNKIKARKSHILKKDLGETIMINDKEFMYPSDHGLVLTEFVIN